MRVNGILLAAGIAPALGLAATKTPGGQIGTDGLASYCDSGGFDTVTLAYISASPETDPATDYLASNFGPHCGAGVYMVNNTASRLLSDCTTLSQDILHCQKLGKRVLLSVGGIWGPDPEHNYSVTTAENGEHFAEFLWKAFGPNSPDWTGPRPFDTLSESHTVLDGFDFDIEVPSTAQDGYVALLKQLRTYIDQYNSLVHANPIIITGSPVCTLVEVNSVSGMKDLITNDVFDKLWVKFYGNNLCAAGSSSFNYDAWETFLANTTSRDALLYVGLPAAMDVPGYMAAAKVNALVDRLQGRYSFGGVMINEVAVAKANADGGAPLYEVIYDHMLAGAQGPMLSSITSQAHVVTKTERATALLTMTVHATAPASIPLNGTNSTQAGTGTAGHTTGTVHASLSCPTASRTVPDTQSGTRTSPTHSYSYSVTSAGNVGKMTGLAWSVVAVILFLTM
ncbi:Chitinase 2 [Sporothrix curviconia]|uniref:chitinase n=1 Tax=Sporothrix curviconia TaxID=1260050 RepID=A0ABP0CQA4_9PEZI